MNKRFPDTPDLSKTLKEIIWFIGGDNYFEQFDDDVYDKIVELIEEPILALICKHEGHRMTADQCGKIEHDLCTTCMNSRDTLEAKDKNDE